MELTKFAAVISVFVTIIGCGVGQTPPEPPRRSATPIDLETMLSGKDSDVPPQMISGDRASSVSRAYKSFINACEAYVSAYVSENNGTGALSIPKNYRLIKHKSGSTLFPEREYSYSGECSGAYQSTL